MENCPNGEQGGCLMRKDIFLPLLAVAGGGIFTGQYKEISLKFFGTYKKSCHKVTPLL